MSNADGSKNSADAVIKVGILVLLLMAAVAWAIQVLFLVSLEKAIAIVVLGGVGILILLLCTGLSPF